jgi:hypothetical protein
MKITSTSTNKAKISNELSKVKIEKVSNAERIQFSKERLDRLTKAGKIQKKKDEPQDVINKEMATNNLRRYCDADKYTGYQERLDRGFHYPKEGPFNTTKTPDYPTYYHISGKFSANERTATFGIPDDFYSTDYDILADVKEPPRFMSRELGNVGRDLLSSLGAGIGLSALTTLGRKGAMVGAKGIANAATDPNNKGLGSWTARRLAGWLSGRNTKGLASDDVLNTIKSNEQARKPWFSGANARNQLIGAGVSVPAFYLASDAQSKLMPPQEEGFNDYVPAQDLYEY